tara:strand:+ start:125 stop:511 length:387 start_codon:yes stop_codon:yes gene_type:complete
MKALTLTSLLAVSAATGAAAGGPFFFAQTTPKAFALALTAGGATTQHTSGGASITVPVDFVLTDLTVTSNGTYAILVNSVVETWWSATTTTRQLSLADGAGIPVPAGSVLRVESSASSSPVSVTGYHY